MHQVFAAGAKKFEVLHLYHVFPLAKNFGAGDSPALNRRNAQAATKCNKLFARASLGAS